MTSRSIRSGLLAGAALLSLTTVALAESGWSGIVVFGDRPVDSGQYVSYDAIFGNGSNPIGDGRQRATSNTADNGIDKVYSQRLSEALGFGELNPSQPQEYPGVSSKPTGLNFASLFASSDDVKESVVGTSSFGAITYEGPDGNEVSVPGTSRPGLLSDPDTARTAENALILVTGGMRDVRELADVDFDFSGTPDTSNSYIETDPNLAPFTGFDAANNIADSVEALVGAGAGLVLVTTMMDASDLPETAGDVANLEELETLLKAREDEAIASTEARIAAQADVISAGAERLTSEANAALGADEAARLRAVAAIELQNVEEVRTTLGATAEDIAAAEIVAEQARIEAEAAEISATVASRLAESAREAEIAAGEALIEAQELERKLALTTGEVMLRPGLNIALADPEYIDDVRRAGTEAYNAQLIARLQNIDGNVLVIDQYSLLKAVAANPALFALSSDVNHTTACALRGDVNPCQTVASGVDTDELLFVDGLDFTPIAHEILSDQIVALLSAPSAVAGTPYIAIGGARGIARSVAGQVNSEQIDRVGLAPFILGGVAGTNLDNKFGADLLEARNYSTIAGLRYSLGNGFAVGAGVGYSVIETPKENSAIDYGGDTIYGTIFAGMDRGGLFGNASLTYGSVDYDATRVSRLGNARFENTGSAEGSVWGATLEMGARLYSKGAISAGPIASFSHFSSSIDGYRENGWEVTSITTGDLDGKSTRAGLGAFLEAGEMVEGRGIVFRGKALYGYEFQDDTQRVAVSSNAPFSVGSYNTLARAAGSAPLELGAELTFGLGRVLTTVGYDGQFGDSSTHSMRFGATLPL